MIRDKIIGYFLLNQLGLTPFTIKYYNYVNTMKGIVYTVIDTLYNIFCIIHCRFIVNKFIKN